MHDVTIDGGGAKLVYHGLQTAFASIRSTDVTFQNFSFDYAAPEVVDATVATVGVQDGHAYRVLKIPAGSPYEVNGTTSPGSARRARPPGSRTGQARTASSTRRSTTPSAADLAWGQPAVHGRLLGHRPRDRRIRIDYATATPPQDAGLVYQMRLIEREEPGAFIWESKNVTMRSIDAHYLQPSASGASGT